MRSLRCDMGANAKSVWRGSNQGLRSFLGVEGKVPGKSGRLVSKDSVPSRGEDWGAGFIVIMTRGGVIVFVVRQESQEGLNKTS